MKKQSDGRYRAKITIGHDTSGKAIVKYTSGRTKKELSANIEELKRSFINGNTEPVQRDILFDDFARAWYRNQKYPNLKASGRETYATILNAHLIPDFGGRQVRAITPDDLQEYVNKLALKYSNSIVTQVCLTLRQIFALATARCIIDKDPTLTLIKPSAKAGVRRALTDAETTAALYVGNTHEYGLLWLILYYTGARLGEVLGLQWRDVDFKTKQLSICRDIDYKQQGDQVGSLKTERSERTIPIAEELMTALNKNRGIGSTYIICSPKNCSYLPQSTAVRHIDALRRAMYDFDNTIEHEKSPQYKLRHVGRCENEDAPQASIITPHYFRHNFATLCYYNGVDVLTAAAWLGHSDPTMIMRVYAHLDKSRGVKSPEKINAIFKHKDASGKPT